MLKLSSLILAAAFAFSFAACGLDADHQRDDLVTKEQKSTNGTGGGTGGGSGGTGGGSGGTGGGSGGTGGGSGGGSGGTGGGYGGGTGGTGGGCGTGGGSGGTGGGYGGGSGGTGGGSGGGGGVACIEIYFECPIGQEPADLDGDGCAFECQDISLDAGSAP